MQQSQVLSTIMLVSMVLTAYTMVTGPHNPLQLQAPLRWLLSTAVSVSTAIMAFRSKNLNLSGCTVATIWLFFLTLANYSFMMSGLTSFITSSKATKFRSERKRRIEADFDQSCRRNWVQVFCNGGVCVQMAIFYVIEGGPGEKPIDFSAHYRVSWWTISALASVCCANADTWASELGTVLSKDEPILITSLARVPRGTNGGVSLVGLVASGIGGTVVSLAFALTQWVSIDSTVLSKSPPQLVPLLLTGFFSGLIGSVVDSLLGATLQYSGLEKRSGKVVEHSGPGIEHISGRAVLNNHSVNLLSNMITALLSPQIAKCVWTFF